ncbi:NYN domain-containing protein [Anaerosporobacter sp.]
MKKLTTGILAHVDAGKTTLSESMLYISGSIRKLGRVDNGDAFLDTFSLERARGITIFSKQAVFSLKDTKITLLDTPGHVDFSAEMERTLQVLDYAILVISGADGVQGHTRTLWKLLAKYKIPVFLFVNKMDQAGTNKEKVLEELRRVLDDGCIDFGDTKSEEFFENVAMCDEALLEQYMESGSITIEEIREMILKRKIFPCFFGAALKLDGVEDLMVGLEQFTVEPIYPEEFGAKIYKIARDEQGNRLTYMKVTGGSLKVKDVLTNEQEKVNQIRIYSGVKYEAVSEVKAGTICAVTGLTKTIPGEGLGIEEASMAPILSPVLTYQIRLPEGCDASAMLPKLRQLEEEEPELHIVWDENLQEIQAQIMGEVQIEILRSLIEERFSVKVEFGTGNIVYKETISNVVEGVGHFEPLRHYAEVHLLLEPGEPGLGLQFDSICSEDDLDRNLQRLVLTHLAEKEHRGVLTGCSITDMKITLVGGRAHQKHTEGGDFRQATYRAIRQGLKQANSVLLEPYYEFQLEVPEKVIGRAITDIEKMYGTFEIRETKEGMSTLVGSAPVITMRDYQNEVIAYTGGHGRLFCDLKGYEPCHNANEIIEAYDYDSEKDLENPTSSVFCSHGAGFIVNWDQVKDYMHVESYLDTLAKNSDNIDKEIQTQTSYQEQWIDTDEIDQILNRTFYANSGAKVNYYKGNSAKRVDSNTGAVVRTYKKAEALEEYLLVDGYNIIYAWQELNQLAQTNMDGARGKLQDILCNYQAIKKCNLIIVYDAYRVQGHMTEIMDYHNIHIVFTKEAETADQYIEKFSQENSRKYNITVATSDGVEQVIIRGQGCRLLSARELEEDVKRVNESLREDYLEKQQIKQNRLFDSISEETAEHIKKIMTDND